ncbi:MAG: iron donor protein CyaY [Alphaproteobacteria bacterium]|nr:iron donor protein CyaY [Alphaproteobacteria bacterium]
MTLDDRSFATLADRTLARILDAVERGCDAADAELRDGILTLELDEGGTFVVNKHGPNREIWLSSPRSGAWHFAWNGTVWASTRGPETLEAVLAADLAAATGTEIDLG